MVMPSAAALARFRADLARYLPDLCQVVRNIDATGDDEDWQPQGSPLPCQLAPAGGGETDRLQNQRFDQAVPYKLLFAAGADVRERDRVTVNGTRTVEVRQMVSTGAQEVERVAIVVERLSG